MNTGGPFYPTAYGDFRSVPPVINNGATIRDVFAMGTLPLIAMRAMNENWAKEGDDWRLQVAFESYKFADAMLIVRDAQEGKEAP